MKRFSQTVYILVTIIALGLNLVACNDDPEVLDDSTSVEDIQTKGFVYYKIKGLEIDSSDTISNRVAITLPAESADFIVDIVAGDIPNAWIKEFYAYYLDDSGTFIDNYADNIYNPDGAFESPTPFDGNAASLSYESKNPYKMRIHVKENNSTIHRCLYFTFANKNGNAPGQIVIYQRGKDPNVKK